MRQSGRPPQRPPPQALPTLLPRRRPPPPSPRAARAAPGLRPGWRRRHPGVPWARRRRRRRRPQAESARRRCQWPFRIGPQPRHARWAAWARQHSCPRRVGCRRCSRTLRLPRSRGWKTKLWLVTKANRASLCNAGAARTSARGRSRWMPPHSSPLAAPLPSTRPTQRHCLQRSQCGRQEARARFIRHPLARRCRPRSRGAPPWPTPRPEARRGRPPSRGPSCNGPRLRPRGPRRPRRPRRTRRHGPPRRAGRCRRRSCRRRRRSRRRRRRRRRRRSRRRRRGRCRRRSRCWHGGEAGAS